MFTSIRSVMGNRGFRKYFTGTIVSAVGDGMQFIGIAWLLTQLTGTTASMGWLLAVSSIPGILFSPWIGVLVDRLDRRLTCMAADLFRGTVILMIPFLDSLHELQVWMLYVIVFLVAIGDRFYFPASGALVREIVPVEELMSANSLSSMLLQMGALLGSGLAGVFIAHYNPVIVMVFNAISFYISATMTFSIRRGILRPQASNRQAKSVYREFVMGVTYLREHPYLIGIGVLQMFLFICLYTTNVLLPSFSMRVLNVGSRGFGFIDAGWAIGAIFGGMLLLGVIRKIGSRRYVTPGMMLLGLSILLFTSAHGLVQAILGYSLMGLFFVSTRINYDTILQILVPTEFQGRVKSTIVMVVSYISFAAYLGVGYLGDVISLRLLYVVLAMIVLVGGVLSIWITRLKETPASTQPHSLST